MRQRAVGVHVLNHDDFVQCSQANFTGENRAPDLNKRGKVFDWCRVLVEKLAEHLVLQGEVFGFTVSILKHANVLVWLVLVQIKQIIQIVKVIDCDWILDELEADGWVGVSACLG